MLFLLFFCTLQLFAEKISKFGSLPACLRRAMLMKFPEFDQYQLGELLSDCVLYTVLRMIRYVVHSHIFMNNVC